jgi:hypothetical protein
MTMLRLPKRKSFAILAAIIFLISAAWTATVVSHRSGSQKFASTVQKMKTVCVGRFLIDLPENAVVSLSPAFIDGFNISTHPNETVDQFAERRASLERDFSVKKNQRGKKSLESAKNIVQPNWSGKVLVYGREWTEMPERGRKVVVEDVTVHALARSSGLSFTFKAEGMAPEAADDARKQIGQLRPLAPGEIPSEPGLCINRGIIHDEAQPSRTESATMFAGLPGHPDLSIVFSSMAGTQRGLGLLGRNARAAAREPFYVRAAFTTLREGKRVINGLPGEELATRAKERNFTTGFMFDWEMGGDEDDVYAPLLTLELETGRNPRPGGKPVQSSLSEAALLELWDKISSSIRVRPASSRKLALNSRAPGHNP